MSVYRLRWKPLVATGLLSGIVQVVAGVVMYVSGVYFAPWSGLVSLFLLAAGVVLGTRWYVRSVLGSESTYPAALLVGMGIALMTGLVYVTYNFLSISFVYPHFLEDMAQARFASRRAGLDATRARELLESLRAQTTVGMVMGNNSRAFALLGTILATLNAVAYRSRARRAAARHKWMTA